jgi:hypothetical protein
MYVKNANNFFEVIGYEFFSTIILERNSIWLDEGLNIVIIVFPIHGMGNQV